MRDVPPLHGSRDVGLRPWAYAHIYTWGAAPPPRQRWNGLDSGGRILENGRGVKRRLPAA